MRNSHPVESTLSGCTHANWNIQIGMTIQIDQADSLRPVRHSRHRGHGNCAVSAQYQREMPLLQSELDAIPGILDIVSRRLKVLRTSVLEVRPPTPNRRIAPIDNLMTRRFQPRD